MIAAIGVLGVAEPSAREEVLAPPELHLVEVRGMRIRGDQALHRLHGLFGAAELVVRPRLLVEDLVVVLVSRVLGEQPVVERDRLERPGRVRRRPSRSRQTAARIAAVVRRSKS